MWGGRFEPDEGESQKPVAASRKNRRGYDRAEASTAESDQCLDLPEVGSGSV